jgi:hypothetical protein
MNTKNRLIIAVMTAIIAGIGPSVFDKWRGAEWRVSSVQVAQASGKTGAAVQPGLAALRPIRGKTANMLFFSWLGLGVLAGVITYISAGKIVQEEVD